jgi:hypothetical protein
MTGKGNKTKHIYIYKEMEAIINCPALLLEF